MSFKFPKGQSRTAASFTSSLPRLLSSDPSVQQELQSFIESIAMKSDLRLANLEEVPAGYTLDDTRALIERLLVDSGGTQDGIRARIAIASLSAYVLAPATTKGVDSDWQIDEDENQWVVLTGGSPANGVRIPEPGWYNIQGSGNCVWDQAGGGQAVATGYTWGWAPINGAYIGHPEALSMAVSTGGTASYATGTCSITSGTSALTGSGTAWLTNMSPGSSIRITDTGAWLRIQTVNSDTSATTWGNAAATATNSAYVVYPGQPGTIYHQTQTSPDPAFPYGAQSTFSFSKSMFLNAGDVVGLTAEHGNDRIQDATMYLELQVTQVRTVA